MIIIVQTVDFKASNKLNVFVKEKVSKLFSHQTNIIKIEVILKNGLKRHLLNQWCEILVSLPGENQFIKKNRQSIEGSILSAVASMERKLKRRREVQEHI